MDDINLVPPPIRKKIVVAVERRYEIQTRNTGNLIRLDKEDFEVLKHVQIFEVGGKIVLKTGVTIGDYLGIGLHVASRKPYDHRREHYAAYVR